MPQNEAPSMAGNFAAKMAAAKGLVERK